MKTVKETTLIPLDSIQHNPLNMRSMIPEQIQILAGTIENDGLLQPLVVYKNGKDYMLIAGHRRLEALRLLYDGEYTVPCIVISKPKDQFEEQALITKGNISRRSPEEIDNEVALAERNYNTMSDEERKEVSQKLRQAFIVRNQENQAFKDDEKTYMANMFKPKYEYIKSITGLESASNTTIKKMIKKEDPDDVAEKKLKDSAKPKKEITEKDIFKAAQGLIGMIKLFNSEDQDLLNILGDTKYSLENIVDYLGE